MDQTPGHPQVSIEECQERFAANVDDVVALRNLLQDLTLHGGEREWEFALTVRRRIDLLQGRSSANPLAMPSQEGGPEKAGSSEKHGHRDVERGGEGAVVHAQAVVGSPTDDEIMVLEEAPLHVIKDALIRHMEDPVELERICKILKMRPSSEADRMLAQAQDLLADLGVEEVSLERTDPERSRGGDGEPTRELTYNSLPPLFGAGTDTAERESEASIVGALRPSRLRWSDLELRDSGRDPSGTLEGVRWEEASSEVLLPAGSDDEYELHLAATEWAVDPAILIRTAEDIQARKHWADLFEPFEHQVRNLITFCRRAPVGLIADDVGLGKTISAGLILSELLVRGKVRKALILAPKLLLPQWREELESKFAISADEGTGADLDALLRTSDIVITTYDSARSRIKKIRQADFDMLILDEAHKLRNLYPAKAPKIARAIQATLKDRVFRYVLMLTATPIQNRLWDLYSLVDLLTSAKGHVNPLGSPDAFTSSFVADGKSRARQLQRGRQAEFRRILGQYMVRTSRAKCGLEFPHRRVVLERAVPDGSELELIRLVSRLIGGMNALAQTSLAQALMSSPAALVQQLRGMEERGSVPWGSVQSAERLSGMVSRPGKLTRLLGLVGELRSENPEHWRVLVFTCRKETQKIIGQALADLYGPETVGFIQGGRPTSNQRSIRGYSAELPSPNVIVSTDAGAEGVNLQAGNVVVNYDLPWNPMILEQRIGRVQRLGSDHGSVIVLNLVVSGSVEERIVGRLAEKLMTISTTLGDLEGVLESMQADGEGEKSFESMIREMVVASMEGKNVERSLARIQESIQRAKDVYEEEKRVVDDQLGNLDAMHRHGPSPPSLAPVVPRLTEKEFAVRGLEAEGGVIEHVEQELHALRMPGRSKRMITFDSVAPRVDDRDVIGFGRQPDVYAAGKRPFETLKGRWQARAGHAIRDVTVENSEGLAAQLRNVVEEFEGAELSSVSLTPLERGFQGTVAIGVSTSIEHDRYEKVMELEVGPRGHDLLPGTLSSSAPIAADDVAPDELGSQLETLLRDASGRDDDIHAFNEYYLDRLEYEVKKAGQRTEYGDLARRNFRPRVSTRVVGMRGLTYEVCRAKIEFFLEGHGPYEMELDCVPASAQILGEPETGICVETSRTVPIGCLGTCDLTGRVVLRHLLGRSDVSGRSVLDEVMVVCQKTGAKLAMDETETSAVSGIVADERLFGESAISEAPALIEELETCSFSSVLALPSELATSEVSERRYRIDEQRRGGVRGLQGHESEFKECDWGGDYCPSIELVKSDVSGRWIREDRLVASAVPPHRRGAPDELVECAVTGEQILQDEAEVSAVSGRLAGKLHMGRSPESGLWALKSELVRCDVKGQYLLPTEVGHCAITGRVATLTIMSESVVSGSLAFTSEMGKCEESGQLALPSELEECGVTGRRVLPSLLQNCSCTGTRALERLMVQSAVSGSWLLESHAIYSHVSNRPAMPNEVGYCAWGGLPRLPDELATCTATGLTVGDEHIDENAVLKVLDDLALSESREDSGLPEVGDLPATDTFPVSKLISLQAAYSAGDCSVAVAGTTKGVLGFGRKRLAQIYEWRDGWLPIGRTVTLP